MEGYRTLSLLELLNDLSDDEMIRILATFSCPYNADVEDFIHNKAIPFVRQRWASVWLVFASYKSSWVPVGYFALASKYFHIDLKTLKNSLRKRIRKFAVFDDELRKYILTAPLIGQLGKNYSSNYDKLITGDELLKIACDTVRVVLDATIGSGSTAVAAIKEGRQFIGFETDAHFYEVALKRIQEAQTQKEAELFSLEVSTDVRDCRIGQGVG